MAEYLLQNDQINSLYICDNWNKESNHEKVLYEAIYSDNTTEQLKVSKQFFHKLEQRRKHNTIVTHEIHLCDPPSPVKGVTMDCK